MYLLGPTAVTYVAVMNNQGDDRCPELVWYYKGMIFRIEPPQQVNLPNLGCNQNLIRGGHHRQAPVQPELDNICTHCNRSFPTSRGCHQHTRLHCMSNPSSKKRMLTCGYCGLKLSTVSGCIQHGVRWCRSNPGSVRRRDGTVK